MTYQYVDNFGRGMVRTRARHAGVPGSLWTAKECVINRANEVVRRLPFRPLYELPEAQTFGGYKYDGRFYVFGSLPGVTVPGGVFYMQLASPTGAPISEILDIDPFYGKLYVVALFRDGTVHHFLDGVRVSDWDALTTAYGSFSDLASAFAAKVNSSSQFTATGQGQFLEVTGHSGVEFTLAATGVNGGQFDNQAAVVTETQALGAVVPAVSAVGSLEVMSGTAGTSGDTTGSFIVASVSSHVCGISSFKISGVELMAYPVAENEVEISLAALAGLLAQDMIGAINANTATTGYSATLSGSTTVNLFRAGGGDDGVTPVAIKTACTLTLSAMNQNSVPSNYLSSILVSGTQLLAGNVPYGASVNATATAVAAAINANTGVSGFIASATGAVVTITAPPALGASLNTVSLTKTVVGTFVISNIVAFTGGVDGSLSAQQKQRIEFTGTFESLDTWTVTIDGTPYSLTGDNFQPGRTALAFRKKLYSSSASVIVFSAVRDATNFTSGIGAGFLNASGERYGDAQITTLAEYAGSMAVFTKQSILVFHMEEDEDLNSLLYTVEGIGSIAGSSVQSFGARDVFFLSWSGVRSLRSRNADDRAFVSDVGTPIDTFIQEWLHTQTADVIARAKSVIDPQDSRYLLSVGTRVFVFSYFPDEKVAGWTYWDLPSEPKAWFRDEKVLYLRMGDVIYAYGGENGTTLPDEGEVTARIESPFFDAKNPKAFKIWDDLAAGTAGTWATTLLFDVNQPDEAVDVGSIVGLTYNQGDHAIDQRATHVAFAMECSSAGEAKITDVGLGYSAETDKN